MWSLCCALLTFIAASSAARCLEDTRFLTIGNEGRLQDHVVIYFHRSKTTTTEYYHVIDYLRRLVANSSAQQWTMVEYLGPREAKRSFTWTPSAEALAQLDKLRNQEVDTRNFNLQLNETIDTERRRVVVLITRGRECETKSAKKAFQLIGQAAPNGSMYVIYFSEGAEVNCTREYRYLLESNRPNSVAILNFGGFDKLSDIDYFGLGVGSLNQHSASGCRYWYEFENECYFNKSGGCVREVKMEQLGGQCPGEQRFRIICPASQCARVCEKWTWSDWSLCDIERNETNEYMEKGTKIRWREKTPGDICWFFGCPMTETAECDMREQSGRFVEGGRTNFSCPAYYRKKNYKAVEMAVILVAAIAIVVTFVVLTYFLVERADWMNRLLAIDKRRA